jgi:hypothetical protein
MQPLFRPIAPLRIKLKRKCYVASAHTRNKLAFLAQFYREYIIEALGCDLKTKLKILAF